MDSEKVQKKFECNCGNIYKYRQGLVKHKKKCSLLIEKPLENILIVSDITNPSFIMNLVKDNQELKSLLMESQRKQEEQNKKQEVLINKVIELSQEPRIVNHGNVTHNGNITQNNQKHFNLQFFLNDTCKDAINMNEFLKSIEFKLEDLEDLEETARLGYVDGISRIFVNALSNLEVNKRPIHCTDIKRETVYIKDEDKWEKENTDKQNLKKAVDFIANKNMYQINDWKEENPNWTDNESEQGQVLNKLYMATTGGFSDEEDKKYVCKIIKNVLQEVVVDKDGE
jgi:protein-tyrosine phosphatase